jgi:hypothetical protein
MPVDAGTVDWLKTGGLFEASTSAGIAAAFGADAAETEIMSCLALLAAATTEAARQQAFLGGPLAIDVHDVPGLQASLIGRPVTIVSDRLGYDAGLVVFVIGVEEAELVKRTKLTVLRKLP